MPNKKLIEDLPSNSKSSRVAPIRPRTRKSEEAEVEVVKEESRPRRVARGMVVTKKKSISQTIAEAFVGDGTGSVGGYILQEVLIPALKNLVSDAVTSGIEMILYGQTKGGRSRGRERDGKTVINYSSFSRRDRDDDRRRPIYRDKFDLKDIYFIDHTDAEEVLDELCDRLEDYDQVSVADYFELAGIGGATHAHYKWGWTDLKRARCTHTIHGWAIILPDPEELD